MALDDIAMSEGVKRFIGIAMSMDFDVPPELREYAERNIHVTQHTPNGQYSITYSRKHGDPVTCTGGLDGLHDPDAVTDPMTGAEKSGDEAITMAYQIGGVVHFLVHSSEVGRYVSNRVLRDIIGITKKGENRKEHAMERARAALAGEMEPGCMGPFVSEGWSDELRVLVDEGSLSSIASVNFSTGVPGNFFYMKMSEMYNVLKTLHPGKISSAKLFPEFVRAPRPRMGEGSGFDVSKFLDNLLRKHMDPVAAVRNSYNCA